MENNLENIPKEEVVSFDGVSYLDFRKTLTPNYKKVWQDIGKAYFFISFLILLSLSLETLMNNSFWILIPLLSITIGYFMANLKLFIHEAAHENIHSDKHLNDVLANVFLCSWFGILLRGYRIQHWQHHYLLGTVEDCENTYFKTLSIKLLLAYLSGIMFFQKLINEIKGWNRTKQGNLIIKKGFSFLLAGLLHGLIIFACIYFNHTQTAVIWLVSIIIFLPFFSDLRQILEHRDEWADPQKDFSKENHGKVCRIFESNFFSKTFGGAGFNRHMLHHWDPEISYTRFDEMEEFLLNTPQCWVSICRSKTTYFDTFLSLVRF